MSTIKDQGEWERCRSRRRMYLALIDAGQEKNLDAIARAILTLLTRSGLSKTEPGALALEYWEHGLKDPESAKPNNELARRSYLVISYACEALASQGGEARAELAICAVIRRYAPVAPEGFASVARQAGVASESAPTPVSVYAEAWRSMSEVP